MRWLIASMVFAGSVGLALLAWLGPGAWPAVLPLAALAAAPLLSQSLRSGVRACGACHAELDRELPFCGRCAAPVP